MPELQKFAQTEMPHVLQVEDSAIDAELTQLAFREAGIEVEFTRVEDGSDAIVRIDSALQGDGPLPDLVLLDIGLPHVGGDEVLAFLRDRESFFTVPVVILTGSRLAEDWLDCRPLKPTRWLVKPDDFQGFVTEVGELRDLLPGSAEQR